MHPDMLLQDHCIGKFLLTDGAGMHLLRSVCTMDAIVRFKVAFSGERPPANFARERPFPGVGAVVHFQ